MNERTLLQRINDLGMIKADQELLRWIADGWQIISMRYAEAKDILSSPDKMFRGEQIALKPDGIETEDGEWDQPDGQLEVTFSLSDKDNLSDYQDPVRVIFIKKASGGFIDLNISTPEWEVKAEVINTATLYGVDEETQKEIVIVPGSHGIIEYVNDEWIMVAWEMGRYVTTHHISTGALLLLMQKIMANVSYIMYHSHGNNKYAYIQRLLENWGKISEKNDIKDRKQW